MMLNADFCYKIGPLARRRTEWLGQDKVTGSGTRQYCQEVKEYQAIPAKNQNLGM